LTPVEGQENTYDLIRADEPIEEGTPLNKATLLSDDTAALLGLSSNATVSDAFSTIQQASVKMEILSYLGNGQYGSSNPNSLTFSFTPYLVSLIAYHNTDNTSCKMFPNGPNGYRNTRTLFTLLTETYSKNYEFDASSNSNGSVQSCYMKRVGNTLYWYNTSKSDYQFNTSGITYYVMAIGK